MSLLDTIDIQGIRSVGIGPHNASIIEFLTPLTVICGPNGSGKTTIIEALKYATTGELPTGKMPVFIHDLRLANRSRVDASVKLKFKDIRGRSCVVTRRMTSRAESTKTNKIVTKSEESTIAYEKEPGEWKSLSSKVIDTKKEVLNLLGLPAAILEYVVFCHQEESTWPLDEPKKLKERFDEIFQVTSYVKSIEELRKIYKQNRKLFQQQELHVLGSTLPFLVKQQENKVKLRNEFVQLKGMVEDSEQELISNKATIRSLKEQWAEVRTDVAAAENSERDCQALEKEIVILQENRDALTVPDYPGNIDDLRREVEAYNANQMKNSEEFVRTERNRKRWESRLNELSLETKRLTAESGVLQDEIGSLKASELMRDKISKEAKDFQEKLAAKYSIVDDSRIGERLKQVFHAKKEELENFQESSKAKESLCQEEIDALNAELAVAENNIALKKKECDNLNADVSNITRELKEAKGFAQQSEKLKKSIDIVEKELSELSSHGNAQQESEKLKAERDKLALKVSSLKEESLRSEAVEHTVKAMNAKKDEATDLEAQLNSLLKKHEVGLGEVFNNEKAEFPVGSRLSAVSKKILKAVSQAEQEYSKLEKEKNKLQIDIEHQSEQIDQTSDKIDSHKSRIEKVVASGDDVETRLAEVNTLLGKSRNDLGLIDGCRYLYEKWEAEAKERKCCPLCERTYKNLEETSQLVTKVVKKRSELPTEIRKLQRKVKELEELQKELMEVVPYVGFLKSLEESRNDLEKDLQKAQAKVHVLEEQTRKAYSERNLLQEKQKMMFEVQVEASLMDDLWRKSSAAQKDAKRLAEELEDEGENRPLMEVREELDGAEERQRNLMAQIDDLQGTITEKNNAVEKLNGLREQYLNLGKKAMQIEALEKTLKEKQKLVDDQTRSVNELKTRKPMIQSELQGKIRERSKLQTTKRAEEDRLMQNVMEIENRAEKLMTMMKQIGEVQDCSEQLLQVQSRLAATASEIEKNNEESRLLSGQLDNVNAQQERKRRLDDQLRKMELSERILKLREEIKETLWSGKPLVELRKTVQRFERQHNDLLRAMERKTGEVEQQKVQLGDLKKKMNTKDLLNADEEYKKSLIQKCVTEKVVEDLALYIRVVDDSVVKYHSEKMEEINEVLAQLWDQVYRGGDIETIQIKSESVDEGVKKKSYNYRVVMTIDGSEIDMPGRCSAGQKMLASILIRIALSDVFCDKCSIIALDEPTTNLDVLKVENLGDMLAQIIQARCNMNRKNFQLIVITHDDRFVDHLRQLCRPDWVYALSKDASGLSKVKRHRTLQEAGMREA